MAKLYDRPNAPRSHASIVTTRSLWRPYHTITTTTTTTRRIGAWGRATAAKRKRAIPHPTEAKKPRGSGDKPNTPKPNGENASSVGRTNENEKSLAPRKRITNDPTNTRVESKNRNRARLFGWIYNRMRFFLRGTALGVESKRIDAGTPGSFLRSFEPPFEAHRHEAFPCDSVLLRSFLCAPVHSYRNLLYQNKNNSLFFLFVAKSYSRSICTLPFVGY